MTDLPRQFSLPVPQELPFLTELRALCSDEWSLGLGRMQALMDHLGRPDRAVPLFHVAGTNGKGSTVATLAALLSGAGHQVGVYTSPHLSRITERVVLGGQELTDAQVGAFLDACRPYLLAQRLPFFEVFTAMALWWCRESGCSVAVIETGLGGRLDATNVIEPLAAGVTSVGLDHQEYLGATRSAIAGEKAGIYKSGAAAVIGESDPSIADLLEARAVAAGARVVLRAGRDWVVSNVAVRAGGTTFERTTARGVQTLTTPLVGRVQAGNASVALAMLEGAGGAWARIAEHAPALLGGVRLSGRFQRVGPWVFDVAHNPDGIDVLLDSVGRAGLPTPLVAVVSVLRDKDWRAMLTALGGAVSHLVLTSAPTAPLSRAWDLGEVAAFVAAHGWSHEVVADFDRALATGAERGATVLVTGSFHTVGDAMDRLQVDPVAA